MAVAAGSTAEVVDSMEAAAFMVVPFVVAVDFTVAAHIEAEASAAHEPMAEAPTGAAHLEARGLTVEAHIEAVHSVAPAAIRHGAGPRADSGAALARGAVLPLVMA